MFVGAFMDTECAKILATAAQQSPACRMVHTPKCSMVRARLRVMEKLATAAAAANRFDMMVAPSNGELVLSLCNAVAYLGLADGGNYDACLPLLRIVQVYFKSGVDTKPSWGDREKIVDWLWSIDDLDVILDEALECNWASKMVRNLASTLHGLFNVKSESESEEDKEEDWGEDEDEE